MASESIIRELIDAPGGSVFVTRSCRADEQLRMWAGTSRMGPAIWPDRPATTFGKLVAKRITPTDATDATNGLPFRVISTDGLNIELGRRNEPLPFYHRNLRMDEMVIAHGGHTSYETELGSIELYPGEVLYHPMGCAHRNFPDPSNVELLNIIIESRAPMNLSSQAAAAFIPAQHRLLTDEESSYREWIDMDGREIWIDREFRPSEKVGLEAAAAVSRLLRHGKVDAAHLPADGDIAPWDGSINVVSAANGLRVDVARAETTPDYWHRNLRSDEIVFVHRGTVTYETELGIIAVDPGEFTLVPRGISHRIRPTPDAVYFITEYPPVPLLWTAPAMEVFEPAEAPLSIPVRS